MRKRLTIFTLLTLPAFAGTLSVQPSTLTASSGQTFSVDIAISGAADLYGYQFDVGYNPAVLSLNSISEGPFLATGGSDFFIPGSINNAAGTAVDTADVLLTAISGVNGNGVLAHASFTVVGAGTSSINLFNGTLLDSSLSGFDASVQNGTVNVTATPEPSGLLLLGTGIALIIRRRQKHA